MKQRTPKALVAVGFAHALLIIALANAAPGAKVVRDEVPVEVVYLEDPVSETEKLPPPPKPHFEPAKLDAVIAPTIAVAVADETRAITVALVENPPPQPVTGTPKLVSSIEYLRAPAPKYPKTARSLGQRGLVVLRALIDVNGRAVEVIVHRSAGFAALDEAARKAVLDASFKPYMEDGRAQPAFVLIPIEFDPSRSG